MVLAKIQKEMIGDLVNNLLKFNNMEKQMIAALGALSLLAACSETSEEIIPEVKGEGVYATIEQPVSVDTRGLSWNSGKLLFTWAEGEKVLVFGNKDAASFNSLTPGEKSTKLESDGFTLNDGVDYYACLPAYTIPAATQSTSAPVTFLDQRQAANDNSEHLKSFDYACAHATKAEGENSISFNLENQVAWIVLEHAFTEATNNVTSVTISADEELFVTEGTLDVTTSTITGDTKDSKITLNLGDEDGDGLSFAAGETFRGFFTLNPVDLSGKTLTFTATTEDGSTITLGTFTKASANLTKNLAVRIKTSGSAAAVATLDGVEYSSLQAAISASEDDSKEITILKDIEVSQLQLFSENRVTINLNGKNVTTTSNTGVLSDGGHLTIKGSGTFGDPSQKTTSYLFHMKAYSVLNIEGDATFYSALDCVYLENETTLGYVDLNIKGGKWIGGEQHGVYWTINKYDQARGDINVSVTGGEFYKYNPAASHSENPVANFVADGYGVIKDGDWYKVVEATEATDEASLKSANTAGSSIFVNESIVLTEKNLSMSDGTALYISKDATLSSTFTGAYNMTLSYMNKGGVISGEGTIVAPEKKNSFTAAIVFDSTNKELVIDGNLTIKGNKAGCWNGDKYIEGMSSAVILRDGKLVINGGHFIGGIDSEKGSACPAVYVVATGENYNAILEINDGVFESATDDASFLINCDDDSKGTITMNIKGGIFVGFNPADNTADGAGTNYVAAGYKSTQTTYNGKTAWVVTKE